jgi:hypothetical protein
LRGVDECRWEHGSEFHLDPHPHWPTGSAVPHPWDGSGLLFGSGRDAALGLLQHGRERWGWRRLWLPSYYCQPVVAAFLSAGLEGRLYPDLPDRAVPSCQGLTASPNDVVLTVNYFGLRSSCDLPIDLPDGVVVIEDHTHDPWSAAAHNSSADYCFASLRKTVPVPDGGVLWASEGRPLPPAPPSTESRSRAAYLKLTAMALKAMFLKGQPIDKDDYRSIFLLGETEMGVGPSAAPSPYTQSYLGAFRPVEWRRARRANFNAFAAHASDGPRCRLLLPSSSDCSPNLCVLVFERPNDRARVREELVREKVYPAVHWPMERPALSGTTTADRSLAERALSLHCDPRYDPRDMERVADILRSAL